MNDFKVKNEMVKISTSSDLLSVECPCCHGTILYDTTMYEKIDEIEKSDVKCPECWEFVPLLVKNEARNQKIDEQCQQCKNVNECDHDHGSLPCLGFKQKEKKKKKKETFQQPTLAAFLK